MLYPDKPVLVLIRSPRHVHPTSSIILLERPLRAPLLRKGALPTTYTAPGKSEDNTHTEQGCTGKRLQLSCGLPL